MKEISKSIRYQNDFGTRLLVSIDGPGIVYFETWQKGYKEYLEINKDSISTSDIEEVLLKLDLVGFNAMDIDSFIFDSECFHES